MASIQRGHGSKYWQASFRLPDGRWALRSTKQTDKKIALRVANEYEAAAAKARSGLMTERQARDVIARIYEIGNGEPLPFASVVDYIGQWLTNKEATCAAASMLSYRSYAKNFLVFLGDKKTLPLERIGINEARAYRNHRLQYVSRRTVENEIKSMRTIWSDAEKDGLIRENPWQRVELGKRDAGTRRAFTDRELEVLLSHATGEWRGMVLFGLYTGQRLGDLACLTWRNVDVMQNEVRLVTSKTKRSMVIPMASPLRQYAMTLDAPDNPSLPVFPRAYEAFKSVGRTSTLSRQFTDLLRDCGLVTGSKSHKVKRDERAKNELSFHSLRHTTTTLLKSAGVSDAVAREIVGHDNEDVSRNYTHIPMETLRDAMAKMPEVVK